MARPDPVDPIPGESGDTPSSGELLPLIRDGLGATIRRLLAPGVGILAAVESIGTIGRRFVEMKG